MLWALLPLKDFVNAKQRLSGVLAANERRHLFHAMVEDVLAVLTSHPELDQTVIVSDDPSAQLLAEHYGVLCWSESSLQASGLSTVVTAAADKITRQGVESLLVVHGDLPLLTTEEVSALIAKHKTTATIDSQAMTIAPDSKINGSNCLLVSPPDALQFQYGDNSFAKHCATARQQGMAINTLILAGASCDVDEPSDLLTVCAQQKPSTKTMSYIRDSGIGDRLELMMQQGGSDQACNVVSASLSSLLANAVAGNLMTDDEALSLADAGTTNEDAIADMTAQLAMAARQIRDQGFHNIITYSRKVFIPLTHLCRDVCHYCTFAQTPKKVYAPYMPVDEVLAQVKIAVTQGCKEALFTLGEKPELRYSAARNALSEMGFASTLEYVAHVAKTVFDETGILPHINAGCMDEQEIAMLRPVSASMGIMLESVSERLCEKGMPHYGSPDKDPKVRLETIARAGQAKVPFTSGILIGIGETRRERVESLLALRRLHQQYGHLQEVIVQNFRAKPDTKMAEAPEPDLNELLWTIAVARLIFGAEMSIQAPPNLSPGVLPQLVTAGLNDWGGVSPLTPDFVNPEAPWPHLDKLAAETANAGKYLHERLTIYPAYARAGQQWLDEKLQTHVLSMIDGEGYPRIDNWSAGKSIALPQDITELLDRDRVKVSVSSDVRRIVAKALQEKVLHEQEIVRLFKSRGDDFAYICEQADQLRQRINGDTVSFVVNRNINYTNICYFKCSFCAFSKGKLSENLRGRPYDIDNEEIARRCQEAWARGATEVCMQGGIHPDYTGQKYLDIIEVVKQATPDMHIHAFSPLEVWQGAATLNLSVREFLQQLKAAGLNTLPGTAAEILDDEVRATLCPDKINTSEWLEVMQTAHEVGFKTTATMMYGHVEGYHHWARHLLQIRRLQDQTGGFTEFVPLPFVANEAPMYLRGKSRPGPTFREALLVHAVARLTLSPAINNIQASWVKMGEAGAKTCLHAGVNDLGGTLMNETITRSAGAEHGQEFSPERLEALIQAAERMPKQRKTDYGEVSEERILAGRNAAELIEVVNTPVKKVRRRTASEA